MIAAALVLGVVLIRRLAGLASPQPVVTGTSYQEVVGLVSELVGARSRERIAEELLELLARSLGLKRLVFFIPEYKRATSKKVPALGTAPREDLPKLKRSRLVALTHRGIPASEAETLEIDLTSESAPGTAARERRAVARETTSQGAFSFGMACPVMHGDELLGVVAGSDVDAALIQLHHGDLIKQLCQLAGIALGKLASFERTAEHADEEERQRKQTYEMLAAYVSPAVAEVLVANPELLNRTAEPAEVTVLFADIQGFTTMCENTEPAEVVRRLNGYLTVMSDIVMKHHGTVDKYVGDQIVAYWNRPVAQPDHALFAAQAALEMVEAQRRLRREWVSEGRAPLKMGIALNSGPVVFGNVGSARKKDLTVIGDTVNTCARLEKLTRVYGVDVIVGERTQELLGDRARTKYHGDHKVKGREQDVRVYSLHTVMPAAVGS